MSKDTDGATVARAFLIIFTILAVLLALACIGRTRFVDSVIIYGYVHFKTIWSTLGTFGVVALVLLLIAVALIVLVGLCGMFGACCRSRCCLIFFAIFAIIWTAVLIALGVVAIVVPPNYFSATNDNNCLKIAAFNDLQSFSEAAQHSICYSCQCYFPKSTDSSVYSTSEQLQLATDAPQKNIVNSALPVRAQDCSGWSSSFSKGITIYSEFEKKFKCTGWCHNTTSLFYKFTDVNNGKPEATCYNRISHYIKRYSTIVTIISFVMAGLMLISLILTIIYLCRMGERGHTPLETQATAQHINLHVDGGRGYPPYPPYPPYT